MARWYAAQTHARGEALALENLLRQGFEAYLPRFRKSRRHARKTTIVQAPLFPRYLFIALDLDAERWRAVHSTRGINRLVCSGEVPAAIPDGIVEEIKSREDEAGMVVLAAAAPFGRGDRVRVTGGALSERIGLFDDMADAKRVFILLELLGRNVRVRLPLDQISAGG